MSLLIQSIHNPKRCYLCAWAILIFLFLLSVGQSTAVYADVLNNPGTVKCLDIQDQTQRLTCYDNLFRVPERATFLEHVWDLDGSNQPLFAFSNFKPIYILLGRYSDNLNDTPSSPSHPSAAYATSLSSVETSYQLSFKNKLMQNIPVFGGSLWFAYTQVSHWQLYNTTQSSPFRANDYEPQLIYSLPVRPEWELGQDLPFDMRWKVLNVGLKHQSNGQSGEFSRSWNRLYAEAGIENEYLTVLLRPWLRIPEPSSDDNPDITDYMGHGELRLIYNYGRQYLSVLGRYNLRTQRGATQLDYVYPISGELQGYVQAFSGYGETLIDYNHRQNTIGFGILIKPWKDSEE
ncbi:MAG: phospholipase A [Ghiorsea sp.]